jgi:hypothetical protein
MIVFVRIPVFTEIFRRMVSWEAASGSPKFKPPLKLAPILNSFAAHLRTPRPLPIRHHYGCCRVSKREGRHSSDGRHTLSRNRRCAQGQIGLADRYLFSPDDGRAPVAAGHDSQRFLANLQTFR